VQTHGSLPRFLFLQGFPNGPAEGERPVAGGTYSDLWRSNWRGKAVAIKSFRVTSLATSKEDRQKLNCVSKPIEIFTAAFIDRKADDT
jgi:hypothetical protein